MLASVFNLGSFSYTSGAGFIKKQNKKTTIVFFISGDSLTNPVLPLFLSVVFLLHIPCWLYFSVGSFSYTSQAGFFFQCGDFFLHIPCWLHCYLGSFSYTSRAVLIFMQRVSLTYPVFFFVFVYLGSFSYTSRAAFVFDLGSFSYTSDDGFIFIWGSYTSCAGFIFNLGPSLTHPVLAAFLPGEFLLHIPCWLNSSVGSFPYTSHAGFCF